MNPNDRRVFERLHRHYEKRSYRYVIREFRKIIKSIDFDNLDFETSNVTIEKSVNNKNLEKVIYNMYMDTGTKFGRFVNAELQREIEKKEMPSYALFSDKFAEFISRYLQKEGAKKVVGLTDTLRESIASVIDKAQKEGKTQAQMVTLVKNTVNKPNFYRSRALRIVRTETLFAMNSAKQVSYQDTDLVVNKVWVHGGSAEARVEHLQMDGVEVKDGEPFILPDGTRMMYPGDQSADASQVVNCSCTFAIRPLRDSNGELILK